MAKAQSGTVVGYSIDGAYNDTSMWHETDPRVPHCPVCGYRTDFFATNPDYKAKLRYKPIYAPDLAVTKRTALAATYDGQTIVTRAFNEFCEREGYKDLYFGAFTNDPEHFHFMPQAVVPYNSIRSNGEVGKLCDRCGNYKWRTAGRQTLVVRDPLPDGFYRTDLLFAGENGKHPLQIIGIETRRKLKAQPFKGIDYEEVYGSEG